MGGGAWRGTRKYLVKMRKMATKQPVLEKQWGNSYRRLENEDSCSYKKLSLSTQHWAMGIPRDNWHTCSARLGSRESPTTRSENMSWDALLPTLRWAPATFTQSVVQGDDKKYPALRLDVGNFSWRSKCCMHKTRIVDVVYNATANWSALRP